MRARSLALTTTLIVCVLGAFAPHLVHATTVINLGGTVLFRHISVLWPSFTYARVTEVKSALRSGDAIGFTADIVSDSGIPLFEADLANLEGPDVTDASLAATSSTADPSFENYTMHINPVAVYPTASRGAQTINLYAYAPFSIGDATTTTIAIDAIAPTISLATTTVSTSANTLTLMMSGSVDGTGSRAKAIVLEGDAYDHAGALLATGSSTHTFVSYGLANLNDAIASSPNGSFARVPVQVDASGVSLAQAAKLVVTLAVADQAGNIATSSTTLPLAPTKPQISNVLFIPGTEASRLYRRDVLGVEHQVWEPDFLTDIPYLAMNADGTSKYALYTKDVVDVIEGHNLFEKSIQNMFGQNIQVYGQFESFLDTLTASSSIAFNAWRDYPYDWRYDPIDVVNDGTLTELPDGSRQRVYLENVLSALAATSATGKVTIVAHSNGGLVAKALLKKLEQEGKAQLVDQLILVGTPQYGTPSDIGVLLHGDGQTEGFGLVMTSAQARSVTKTLPDAYALLPSPAYFERVATPVVTFDPAGSISGLYATQYGSAINSFSSLASFMEDAAGIDAQAGNPNNLRTPIALPSALVNRGALLHTALDPWTPPLGVTVTAIAGWGQPTISGLAYSTKGISNCGLLAVVSLTICNPYLEHAPILTQDGDNTVVSSSAVGNIGRAQYFDTSAYASDGGGTFVHQNLLASTPVQDVISALLVQKTAKSVPYILTNKPPSNQNPLIQVSSHSPVNVVLTDAQGRQTGVVPMPGTEFSGLKQDIPGSAVQVLDDEEYVTAPKEGSYKVAASGYASGTATIEVAEVQSDGRASTTAALVAVPVTASTTVSFSVAAGVPGSAQLDMNGDGVPDVTVATSTFSNDPVAYVRYVASVVKALPLGKPIAVELLARLGAIMRALSVHQRASAEFARYPRLFSRHSPLVNLQISELERQVQEWVAQPSEHKQRTGHQRERERENEGKPSLSITQAQMLLSMLSYLKTLL